MGLDEKLETLVGSLNEKSREGRVEWTVSPYENQYTVSFSNFSVSISQSIVRWEGVTYTLSIQDAYGNEIETISRSQAYSDFAPLEELFALARRKALNVERGLSELLEELSEI